MDRETSSTDRAIEINGDLLNHREAAMLRTSIMRRLRRALADEELRDAATLAAVLVRCVGEQATDAERRLIERAAAEPVS